MFIDFDGTYVSKGILSLLAKKSGAVITNQDFIALLQGHKGCGKLFKLLFAYDTIYLDYLSIEKVGEDRWCVEDLRPFKRRSLLEIFNSLPWKDTGTIEKMDRDFLNDYLYYYTRYFQRYGFNAEALSKGIIDKIINNMNAKFRFPCAFDYRFHERLFNCIEKAEVEDFVQSLGASDETTKR